MECNNKSPLSPKKAQNDLYTIYTQYFRNDRLVLTPSLVSQFRSTNSTIGSSTADFKIIKEIGRGASAVVYKVQSLKDQSIYAMKVISIGHLKPSQQKEALIEVLILKNIQHANIIKFYGSFIENNQLFIFTEYAEQGDLYSSIQQQKKKKMYISEKEIWRLLWQLSLAVLHLHVHNVIHRDIKTLNIFLTKDKVLKLGDVGESKYTDATKLVKCDKIVGTPLYLSPEIIKAQSYDQRVDLWAIGCVLYELLTLVPPFKENDLVTLCNSILTKSPSPIPAYIFFTKQKYRCYSGTIRDLVVKLLEKKIQDRPFIDEIIALPAFKGNKLSKLDMENLEQYKKLKHQFKMRDLASPTSTYQLLIKQLQKNIMKELHENDLYYIMNTGLREQVKREKIRISKEKMWGGRLLERHGTRRSGINKYYERVEHVRKHSNPELCEQNSSKSRIEESEEKPFPEQYTRFTEDLKLPELKKTSEVIGNISTHAERLQYMHKKTGSLMNVHSNTRSCRQTPSPEKKILNGRNIDKLKENGKGMDDNNKSRIMGRGHTIDCTNMNKLVRKVTINDLG